jgi:hypothetical protein
MRHGFVRAAAVFAALLGPLAMPARGNAAPSPAPSKVALVFVPPLGWHHAQGTSDGLGTWQRPNDGDTPEEIIVEAKGGFASLDALFQAEVNYIASLPDQFGYAPTDVTLCGNRPGKYMSYTYSSPSGVPVTSELVIGVFGTTGYMVRYDKTITQWADPAAEKSIMTLCGHTTVHSAL